MKKLFNKLSLLFLVLFLSIICLTNRNDSEVYAYEPDTFISDLVVSKEYLAKRGVLGVENGGAIYTYPFFSTTSGEYVYCIDDNWSAAPADMLFSNVAPVTLDEKIHKALSSSVIALNPSLDKVYDGDSFFEQVKTVYSGTGTGGYGTDYVELTNDDFRYASQIALHLYAGHFTEDKLVKIDTYYKSATDGYVPSHTEIDSADVDQLFLEIKSLALNIRDSLNNFTYADGSTYFTAPYQTGNGFTAVLPTATSSNELILPVTGSIVLNSGSTFSVKQFAYRTGQTALFTSLLLNTAGAIPVPENSGISKIEFCDTSGMLTDVGGPIENDVLTNIASHVKITISDISTFNAWIIANADNSIQIKNNNLGIYYIDNQETSVNANRDIGGTPIQEMGYPVYKPVEISILKLSFPSISNSVTIHKNEKGTTNPVKDAVIELRDSTSSLVTTNADGVALTLKTNASGDIVLTNIPAGTYTFKEVTAPTGYYLNNSEYTFTLAADGTVTGTTTFDNIKAPDVTITKTDSYYTSEGVSGAVYKFKKDGADFATKTTNAQGKITLNSLNPGVYTYQEVTAPAGYLLDSGTYTFTVAADGKVTGNLAVSDKHFAITFTKQDEANGAVLPGAKFKIYDSSSTLLDTVTTNAAGKVHFEVTNPGTYKVVEVEAPAGYTIKTTDYSYTVNADASQTGPSIIYNTRHVSPYAPPTTGD